MDRPVFREFAGELSDVILLSRDVSGLFDGDAREIRWARLAVSTSFLFFIFCEILKRFSYGL